MLRLFKRQPTYTSGVAEPGGRKGPLGPYGELLPAARPLTVLIVSDRAKPRRIIRWLRQFSTDRIHVVSIRNELVADLPDVRFERHLIQEVAEMAELVKPLGPIDVMVDLRAAPSARRDHMWYSMFLHLADRGLYVRQRNDADGAGFLSVTTAWVGRIAAFDNADSARLGDRSRASAIGEVVITRELLLMTKIGRHYLKLTEADTSSVLLAREPAIGLNEFTVLPPGELTSAATIISHDTGADIGWPPTVMPYPPMHLRHYTGDLVFAGAMLVYTRTAILSASFRAHFAHNPHSPAIVNISPSLAALPANRHATAHLPGNYFLLDAQYPGHFGHIMTEVIPRLWGWDAAKRRIPDLKGLFRAKAGTVPELEVALLRGYGIADDDIVWVDEPVRIDSLVTATSMWHNNDPYYVHPGLRAVWDRMRTNLASPDAPTYERVFVSKSRRYPARTCRNSADVEQLFVDNGFTVIYPDELNLSMQVGIFASARVIAGFAGSAMFSMMYAQKLETMIVLTNEAYTARHEYLYASLLGITLHHFWSPPDIPHPEGGWSSRAFLGSWEFDFDRNTDALLGLLQTI